VSEVVAGQTEVGSTSEGGFRARTVLWLVVIATAAALAFAALGVFAPEIRANNDSGANAMSRSAVGYAGLVRLLKETGRPVLVSRSPLPPRVDGAPGLLVLTPGPRLDQAEMDTLINRANTVLIIAPKWFALADQDRPGWVKNLVPVPPEMIRIGARKDLEGVARANGAASPVLTPPPGDQNFFSAGTILPFGPVDRLQTRTKGIAAPALVDQTGAPVLLQAKGNVFVLTDPDLLNNRALANLTSARSAVALLDGLRGGADGPVVFDVTLNGLRRTRSLWQVALEPPFLAATLCVLAAALLMGWRAAAPFGAVERRGRAVALGKRALVESSAGLIRLTRREPRMATRYAALIRSQALAGAGERAQSAETADAYLDQLAGNTGQPPFTRLAQEASEARTPAALMRAVQALYLWKSEVVRERR